MSTYAKTIIIGFLGADPESKTFEGGGSLCNVSVAVTEKWKDKTTQEEKSFTEWYRVVLRNKTGELAQKYLKKGSKVLIEGKMRTRMWEKEGVKNYSTELIGQTMTFMGGGEKSQEEKPEGIPNSQMATSEPDDLPF